MKYGNYKIFIIKFSILTIALLILIFILKILPTLAAKYRQTQFKGKVCEWETENFRFTGKNFDKNYEASELTQNFYRAFYKNFRTRFKLKFFSTKPEIFIFKDRKEFLQYHKNKTWTDLPNNSAYYDAKYSRILMHWNLDIKRTIYHELTHLIMDLGINNLNPQWSLWFSEGIAVYFEFCHIVKNNLKLIPEAPPISVQWFIFKKLQNNNLLTVPEILKATRKDFQGKNNELYYYQSYMMIDFLIHSNDGQYKDKFFHYFNEESKNGKCPTYIFWKIIGKNPKTFSQEYYLFLKKEAESWKKSFWSQ